MWKSCEPAGHEWVNIPTWCGRYRCQVCSVLGYRGVVVGTYAGARMGQIIPYKCPRCHGPTTGWRRKRAGEFRVRDGAQLCPACEGVQADGATA